MPEKIKGSQRRRADYNTLRDYQEGASMVTLVEKIVSLENEADSIVAAAHDKARELEKSAMADVEAYRRKLSEDMEAKISSFQIEMEAKHKASTAEAEEELVRALGAVDRVAGSLVREQIDRITQAFLPMKKLIISDLEKAYKGGE
jgi:hypothetical protein